MSLINLEQLGMVLNAISSKIKSVRGNWNQNDPNADDYIKNRTHYEAYEDDPVEKPLIITWDGNTDGKVQATEDGNPTPIVKISDIILTDDQFRNAVSILNGQSVSLSDMWDDFLSNGDLICEEAITFLFYFPFAIVRKENVEFNGLVFPEAGIYTINYGDGNYISHIETTHTVIEKTKVVHCLDEKYIPDTIARVSDMKTPKQPDWNQTDTSALDYIKNKPSIVSSITTGTGLTAYKSGNDVRIDLSSSDTLILDGGKAEWSMYCGLYDTNYNLKVDWYLLFNKNMKIDNAYTASTCKTNTSSPQYVLNQYAATVNDNFVVSTSGASASNSVARVGSYAFYQYNKLAEFYYDEHLTIFLDYAFSGCENLINVEFHPGYGGDNYLQTIRPYAFYNCPKLEHISLSDSATTDILEYAFAKTGFKKFTFPANITKVNQCTLWDCNNLTEVTIQSKVTSIGSSAFADCEKLKIVKVLATTPPTLNSTAFQNDNALQEIRVPSASVNAYKSASGWSTYASKIVAI